MYSLTKEALEQYDNPGEFERLCADVLNGLGYRDIVLIAPVVGVMAEKILPIRQRVEGKA